MIQDEIEAVAHRWHLEVVQACKLEVAGVRSWCPMWWCTPMGELQE